MEVEDKTIHGEIVSLRARAEKAEAEVERLTYKVQRAKELYLSATRIVRRYQEEREHFLDKVKAALLGIKSVKKS